MPLGISDLDEVVLRESLQQEDALVQHAVPRFATRVFQGRFNELSHSPVGHGFAVLPAEVRGQY